MAKHERVSCNCGDMTSVLMGTFVRQRVRCFPPITRHDASLAPWWCFLPPFFPLPILGSLPLLSETSAVAIEDGVALALGLVKNRGRSSNTQRTSVPIAPRSTMNTWFSGESDVKRCRHSMHCSDICMVDSVKSACRRSAGRMPISINILLCSLACDKRLMISMRSRRIT